ncbi:MAG: chaperone modulator CbpM [Bacteriovorax sp.]|nr:chaperone modulator CbpM [Bacteriovorax sp.]
MRTTITFEISEAALRCGLNPEDILQFITSEWIQPLNSQDLLLDEDDIARILLIRELKVQLGVNDEGVPIILHLIDQLNHLHLELR